MDLANWGCITEVEPITFNLPGKVIMKGVPFMLTFLLF